MEYFTIKEASKRLGLETHVLRYWEEELGLTIKRNDMGYRYYDSRNIEMFEEIQKLKEQGFSLKDIRSAIESYQNVRNVHDEKQVLNTEQMCEKGCDDKIFKQGDVDKEPVIGDYAQKDLSPQVVEFKTAQLQSIMNKVVANAFRENKEVIVNAVKGDVMKEVIHQFDLIMRENDEKEDERFRKLDENLRRIQQANEEVAATCIRKHKWRRK